MPSLNPRSATFILQAGQILIRVCIIADPDIIKSALSLPIPGSFFLPSGPRNKNFFITLSISEEERFNPSTLSLSYLLCENL